MCFSPQADLVGGVVISGFGIDAVRHLRSRRRFLPLAALPLILGAHQIIEAFVWWSAQGHLPHQIGSVALWGYLLIALVFLPVFVPLAVLAMEPTTQRRLAMAPFVMVGVGVAAVLFAAMLRHPITVTLRPHHLAYNINPGTGWPVVALYVVAVCGALLLSGERHILLFGLVNLIAIGLIAWLTVDGFASVWCGWAAVTSGGVAAHMRFGKPHRARPYALA